MRSYTIPVSNGIFSHRERIGGAIWVFLWLIDHTTKEIPALDGKVDGLVYNGRPVLLGEISTELAMSPRSVREHLTQLAEGGYIRKLDHGIGFANGYAVVNSKRFGSRRGPDSGGETPAEKGKGTPTEKGRGTPAEKCQGSGETPTENCRTPYVKLPHPRQKSVTVDKETEQCITKQSKVLPTARTETVDLVLTGDAETATNHAKKAAQKDSRFTGCVTCLADYWKTHGPGVPFPFSSADGSQLKTFLSQNPELTLEQFAGIVRNRADSEKNHSEPARVWLPSAMKYAGGPLNQYGNPMTNGDHNNGKRYVNRAQEAADSALAGTRAALESLGIDCGPSGEVGRDDGRADGQGRGPVTIDGRRPRGLASG